MSQLIKREQYRPSPARRNTYECELSLPDGEWIVWWYSTVERNTKDHTVPLVRVILRKLDGDTLTNKFEGRLIALSRLCFYQPGYILIDGQLKARVVSEERWFDVNFCITGKNWGFVSSAESNLCSTSSSYLLPNQCADDLLISFQHGKGELLLNCIEFLVRGYSRRSELPRILTTYRWSEIEARLLSQKTPQREKNDNSKWVVYPHKDMLKDDELFLAHFENSPHTREAAKLLFSQLTNSGAYMSGMPQPLMVRPWFNTPTKLKCRGFSITDASSQTERFICTELSGYAEPDEAQIDVRRFVGERIETAPDTQIVPNLTERRLRDNVLEMAITDVNQPRSLYPREEIDDGEFEVIRANNIKRSKVDKPYGERKKLEEGRPVPSQRSTGEPKGQRDPNTGKVGLGAREVDANSDGLLEEMWKSFRRLKKAGEIKGLWWFVPPRQMQAEGPPRCVPFSVIEPESAYEPALGKNPISKRKKWLALKDGRERGMLLLIIETSPKEFCLVAEIERDRSVKNKVIQEESYSGFICPVKNRDEAAELCTLLDIHAPRNKGRFRNFRKLLPADHYLYTHRPAGDENAWFDLAATNALKMVKMRQESLGTQSE